MISAGGDGDELLHVSLLPPPTLFDLVQTVLPFHVKVSPSSPELSSLGSAALITFTFRFIIRMNEPPGGIAACQPSLISFFLIILTGRDIFQSAKSVKG